MNNKKSNHHDPVVCSTCEKLGTICPDCIDDLKDAVESEIEKLVAHPVRASDGALLAECFAELDRVAQTLLNDEKGAGAAKIKRGHLEILKDNLVMITRIVNRAIDKPDCSACRGCPDCQSINMSTVLDSDDEFNLKIAALEFKSNAEASAMREGMKIAINADILLNHIRENQPCTLDSLHSLLGTQGDNRFTMRSLKKLVDERRISFLNDAYYINKFLSE